jgi:hypothetical protein
MIDPEVPGLTSDAPEDEYLGEYSTIDGSNILLFQPWWEPELSENTSQNR